MNRPWATWAMFTLCLVVVMAATGWISAVVWRLDRKDAAAARGAQLEENVRLALWRMDSSLASLIGRENARPYVQYAAFYPTQRAYTNLLTALEYGDVLLPSPLLTFQSQHIKLHFQLDPEGQLTSPQVPTGNMLDLAQASPSSANIVRQKYFRVMKRRQ